MSESEPVGKLNSTNRKLREAEFFLNQVELTLDQPEILMYYISAFVSAARSVTFVMQYEIGKNHEFKAWYLKKQKQMNEDEIFSLFNSLRFGTIHNDGKVKFTRKISLRIIEANVKQPPRKITLYFEDMKERDGLEVCEVYLDKLSRLVKGAETFV
jgi:hypothetical protein